MKFRFPLALSFAALITTTLACNPTGEVEVSGDETIVEDVTSAQHGDLMYVLSNAELQEKMADGDLVLRPEHPFMGVLLNFAAEEVPMMTYAVEDLDGNLSEFAPVVFQTPEGKFVDAHVGLTSMSSAIHLRFEGETAAIDFVRAEFLETSAPEGEIHFDDDWSIQLDEMNTQPSDDVIRLELARSGPYSPNSAARSASPRQSVGYDDAPSWNGGRNCGGTFKSGTKQLAEYLVKNFRGARSYGGYSCRQNTASPSKTSVHGTGRAIDLFVPLDRGQADNDLGDPIANWLIQHAQEIGIQYFIWDRTSWGASRSGTKWRAYTGPHPHHDHLHIELSVEGAAKQTAWFRNGGSSGGGSTSSGCWSRTLNKNIPAGQCVQMPYEACGGGTCKWAKCTQDGAWSCTAVSNCGGTKHGASSCGGSTPTPTPTPAPNKDACWSKTMGKNIEHGACVQMNYSSCGGGACKWAECNDGSWTCVAKSACDGKEYAHSDCSAPAKDACWSKTMGKNIPHNQWVQMSYTACGGKCRWARCDDGAWQCGTPGSGATKHGHRSCN